MSSLLKSFLLIALIALISGPLSAKGFNTLTGDISQCYFDNHDEAGKDEKKKPVEGETAEEEEEEEEPDCE